VGPMTAAQGSDASACYFAHTPQGQGNSGYVDVLVDVPGAGSYWIWGRIWGLDWSGDSLLVSVDGGPASSWHFGSRGSWQWERVTNNYASMKWNLSAGRHTIRFTTREDGARLDVVELSSDPVYVPSIVSGCGPATETPTPTATPATGPSPSATPSPTPSATPTETPTPAADPGAGPGFEAELGTVANPMTVGSDQAASACLYVHTPQGQGSNGFVDVRVDVPVSGSYWIWGRIWGLDWSGDSMVVTVDGGPEAVWHFGSRGSWQWEPVTSNYASKKWNFSAGVHTIRFKTREDGARLDLVELSSDPAYMPSFVLPCGGASGTGAIPASGLGMSVVAHRDEQYAPPSLYLAMLVKL
jgi:hypothetical protein